MTVKVEDFVREEHERAVRNFGRVAHQMKSHIDTVLAKVGRGDPLNDMGELQAMSSEFEARVGAYCATREAFQLLEKQEQEEEEA